MSKTRIAAATALVLATHLGAPTWAQAPLTTAAPATAARPATPSTPATPKALSAPPLPRALADDPNAPVPPAVHRSALRPRSPEAVPVGSWSDANRVVDEVGGWKAYLKEAHGLPKNGEKAK